MKPVQARQVNQRATPSLDLFTTPQSSRRSLLQRGFAFGLAAPIAISGSRAFARQDTHGSDETGTPTSANDEHVEAPVPAELVRPFALYDPVLQPVEAGAKQFTVVAQDATLLIATDIAFAG